jgi:uncharacterized protein YjbI with pentapeptide repeats
MEKTKFQIKSLEGQVIVEMEAETLKEVVEKNKKNLQEANLQGADLWEANLQGADLQGADLQGADLRGADLRGADIRWADIFGMIIIKSEQENLIKSLGVVTKE